MFMKQFIFLLMILFFGKVNSQSFSKENNFIKVEIKLNQIGNEVKLSFLVINISQEVVFIYNGSTDNSYYMDESIIGIDISSGFITDPLSFPKYKMELIQLNPSDSTFFTKNKIVDLDSINEIQFLLDFLVPSKAKEKKLIKIFKRIFNKKKKVLFLKDYWVYKEKYSIDFGGTFIFP